MKNIFLIDRFTGQIYLPKSTELLASLRDEDKHGVCAAINNSVDMCPRIWVVIDKDYEEVNLA